ncbi:MAG: hypothetical protein PF445_07020 [Melioribacteraceae bacterium]|jgi:hypothetical protein|nr:hypothetical protein [Melioribacteraceae bacterium]
MKTFQIFILAFTTLIYSQENYHPDKLVSKSSASQECFIQEVNSEYVVIKSSDNSGTMIFLTTLNEINIDSFGLVYSESTGYTVSLKSINDFLEKRSANNLTLLKQPKLSSEEQTTLFNSGKRFFFAINYFPSITKQLVFTYKPYMYRISSNSYLDQYYQPMYFELEQNLVSMESQFGFNVANNLFITLSIGYSSDLYKSTSTTTDQNIYYGTVTTRLNENQNSMDKFLLGIGLKYYFGNFEVSNVNPFVLFSIGQQFAFFDNYNRNYYIGQNNDYEYTDNENEFMEGLNSPIFISGGFGAEYAISKSLTLSGFFKVKYNSASSTYKWKNTDNGVVTNQGEEDVENTTVRFKTGLGLNFFF